MKILVVGAGVGGLGAAIALRHRGHHVDVVEVKPDFTVHGVGISQPANGLRALRGNEVVNGWQDAARTGRTADVVRDLLVAHYDPIYLQSMRRNFAYLAEPWLTLGWDGSELALRGAARAAIAASAPNDGPPLGLTPCADRR